MHSAEEALLADSLTKYPFSWSADGEHLLYATIGPDQDLWTLSMTDRKSRPFMQTSYNEYAGPVLAKRTLDRIPLE